jgi:DNA-binding XRE family transcriptional regulator
MTQPVKRKPHDEMMSPAQCRAARAMLQWSQSELARRAKVARKTIADFEQQTRALRRRTRNAITGTIEAAGVHFVWDDDGQVVCVEAEKGANLEPSHVGK